jgi:hypothetical protein
VKVDKTLDQVSPSEYDAVVLPGGQINPDLLRALTTLHGRQDLSDLKPFYYRFSKLRAIVRAPERRGLDAGPTAPSSGSKDPIQAR